MAKILIVEDTITISDLIKYSLEKNKHQIDAVFDGKSGLEYAFKKQYDLIFIDVMIPFIDGFTLCRKIREINQTTYIIFITALNDEENLLKGLSIGGDDYITKPFSMSELLARTDAGLRRINNNFNLDEETEIFGKEVHLTDIEYRVFKELIKNKNITVTREDFFKIILGYEYDGKNRIIDVHINKLRKKIQNKFVVSSIRGKGYKMVSKK